MKKYYATFLLVLVLWSCDDDETVPEFFINEDAATFTQVGTIDIGDAGAAEISAYDPSTKRLFVVNNSNTNRIDVIDFQNPSSMTVLSSIELASYAGAANSVSVRNGLLAVALEAVPNKQADGKVLIFKTSDLSEVKSVTVGALPDMVTFSADGNFIVTANEGEPNADYSFDPDGSISIISVNENYSVTTLKFGSFASQASQLQAQGLRVFGKNASFVQDMEPEYVAISQDSKMAWVTLQENNAIATVDLVTKTITGLSPLGFKDFNQAGNSIDVSDQDNTVAFAAWKTKGMYQPDAIDAMTHNGTTYLFTANEGDAREYGTAMVEPRRLGNAAYVLDPVKFPDAATLKLAAQMGRLNVTTLLGNTDTDTDFDEIYTFGARSFSVWNASTGALVYDSKNELEVKAQEAAVYDDARSDDKGVEPEGIVVGKVSNKFIAFVGLERADAIAVYDVTNPTSPVFLQLVKTGDAPEGVLFIAAKDSPTQKSLLVVSSENDGKVHVYQPNTI